MHCIRFPSPLPTLSPIHLPNHFPIGGLTATAEVLCIGGLTAMEEAMFFGGILSTAIVLLNCGGVSNDRIDKLWR